MKSARPWAKHKCSEKAAQRAVSIQNHHITNHMFCQAPVARSKGTDDWRDDITLQLVNSSLHRLFYGKPYLYFKHNVRSAYDANGKMFHVEHFVNKHNGYSGNTGRSEHHVGYVIYDIQTFL